MVANPLKENSIHIVPYFCVQRAVDYTTNVFFSDSLCLSYNRTRVVPKKSSFSDKKILSNFRLEKINILTRARSISFYPFFFSLKSNLLFDIVLDAHRFLPRLGKSQECLERTTGGTSVNKIWRQLAEQKYSFECIRGALFRWGHVFTFQKSSLRLSRGAWWRWWRLLNT